MFLSRRGLLMGLGTAIAAPTIVKIDNLMQVRGIIIPTKPALLLPAVPGIGLEHWKLVGRDVVSTDLYDWADNFRKPNRFIAATRVGARRVSTMFVGIDHGITRYLDPSAAPVLFETMVFGDDHGGEEMNRYSTYDEAERGHSEMVAKLRRERFAIVEVPGTRTK